MTISQNLHLQILRLKNLIITWKVISYFKLLTLWKLQMDLAPNNKIKRKKMLNKIMWWGFKLFVKIESLD